jgi:hypothetical protein
VIIGADAGFGMADFTARVNRLLWTTSGYHLEKGAPGANRANARGLEAYLWSRLDQAQDDLARLRAELDDRPEPSPVPVLVLDATGLAEVDLLAGWAGLEPGGVLVLTGDEADRAAETLHAGPAPAASFAHAGPARITVKPH